MQLNLYPRWAEIEINAQELWNYSIVINNVGQKINNTIILKNTLNMLWNLIVSLVRIKVKSNYINFAAETCRNFYFQKQNCELSSLNNIVVGANMNRDQIITESIQKLLKMLLEKEKTTKNSHC